MKKLIILIVFISSNSYSQTCEKDRSKSMEYAEYFEDKWVKKALVTFKEIENRFEFDSPTQKLICLVNQNKLINVGQSINFINLSDSSLEFFREHYNVEGITIQEHKTYSSTDSAYLHFETKLNEIESAFFLQQNLSRKEIKKGSYDSEFILIIKNMGEVRFMMVSLNGSFFKSNDTNYPPQNVKMLAGLISIIHTF